MARGPKQIQNINFGSAGSKFIRLDGGLNQKVDPFLMAQDGKGDGSVTTANNLWYITPGQARSLPPFVQGAVSSALTPFIPVYALFDKNAAEPFKAGDIGGWVEVNDLSSFTSPKLFNGSSSTGASFSPAAPSYPYSVRIRPMNAQLGTDNATGTSPVAALDSPAVMFHPVSGAGIQLVYMNNGSYAVSVVDPMGNATSSSELIISGAISGVYTLVADPVNAGVFYFGTRGTYGALTVIGTNATYSSFGAGFSNLGTQQNFDSVAFNGVAYFIYVGGGAMVAQPLAPTGLPSGQVTIFNGFTAPISPFEYFVTAWVDSNQVFVAYQNGTGNEVRVKALTSLTTLNAGSGTQVAAASTYLGGTGTSKNGVGTVFLNEKRTLTTTGGFTTSPTDVIRQRSATFTYSGTTVTAGTNYYFTAGTGSTLCTRAFNLGQKNALVLMRTGTNDLAVGFYQLGQAPTTQRYYAQPTYFLMDSQLRVVSRFAEGLAPNDPTTNQGVLLVSGDYQRSYPKVEIFTTPNNSSAIEAILPIWRNVVEGFRPGAFSTTNLNLTGSTQSNFTVGGIGPPNIINVQPSVATLSLPANLALTPALQAGKSTVVPGALSTLFDGRVNAEAGFHNAPHAMTKGSTVAASSFTISGTVGTTINTGGLPAGIQQGGIIAQGTLTAFVVSFSGSTIIVDVNPGFANAAATFYNKPAGNYLYRSIYRWADSSGQIHRSAPSAALPVTQAVGFQSQNINVPTPVATFKGEPGNPSQYTGGPVFIELYVTDPNGTTFYLSSTVVSKLQYNLSTTDTADLFATANDVTFTLANPYFGVAFPGYWQTHYKSDPPPNFIWQVMNQGRHFGLACVDGNYRIFFTNIWTPGFPVEWNVNGYIPVPPELGDCRSITALDDCILVFGTRGVGFFNGNGPGTAVGSNGIDLDVGVGFSTVAPIPNAGGVVGSGCPVTLPDGVIYQASEGFMMIDRSRTPMFIGDKIDQTTGVYGQSQVIYGTGRILTKLQCVVFTNPAGDSLAYNYNDKKWSIWQSSVVGPIASITQRQDGTIFAAQQPVSGATLPATYNTTNGSNIAAGVSVLNGNAVALPTVTNFTLPTYTVETPWLQVGDVIAGEGDTWEMMVLGTYFSPHRLRVETAVNFADYGSVNGYLQEFVIDSAPKPSYQYSVHSPEGTRIWAVRYRITVLPPTPANVSVVNDYARISGLMMFSGSIQGNTRVGYGVSR